jgi:hypothetical protein
MAQNTLEIEIEDKKNYMPKRWHRCHFSRRIDGPRQASFIISIATGVVIVFGDRSTIFIKTDKNCDLARIWTLEANIKMLKVLM